MHRPLAWLLVLLLAGCLGMAPPPQDEIQAAHGSDEDETPRPPVSPAPRKSPAAQDRTPQHRAEPVDVGSPRVAAPYDPAWSEESDQAPA